jgi:hypothetical protein
MNESKKDRIEKLNEQIVFLIFERRRAERFRDFPREQNIREEINKLEEQIKKIQGE